MIKDTVEYMEQYVNHTLTGQEMNEGLLYKASILLQDWFECISPFPVPFKVSFDYQNSSIRVTV